MKQRRAELWREWATGNEVVDDYQKKELPIIANWFASCWDCSADDLHSVKREIVSLLEVCGAIPPVLNRSIIRRVSSRTRDGGVLNATEAEPDRRVRQRYNEEQETIADDLQRRRHERSDTACIDLSDLQTSWKEHKSYVYVGSLEILTKEAHVGKTLAAANERIASLGGIQFSGSLFDSMLLLGKSRLGRKLQNFAELRRQINDSMPDELFHIPHDRLLLEWISDGKRYTDGERLPRTTHAISKDNGQNQHTDKSAYMLYKIYTGHDISMSKFNGLYN